MNKEYIESFGCLPEVPSIRDYTYEDAVGAGAAPLPDAYILPEDKRPAVTNQGAISACCAFSAAEILYCLNKREFGDSDTFSEGFIYGYDRPSDSQCVGMYPNTLMKALCATGSVPKQYYDKLYEMPDMKREILRDENLDTLVDIAKKYRISGFARMNNPEMIKRCVYETQIPVFAICGDWFGESHAIIVVGWDNDEFVIQNSWGTRWGDKGIGNVPLSAVDYGYQLIDEVLEMNFTDVKETDWFYDAVKECVFNGLIKGRSDTEFAPNEPLTRAEAAQLMKNLNKKIDDLLKLKKG